MATRLGSRITFEDVHPDDVDLRTGKVRVVERSGVVWALADCTACVWVIPDGERHTVKVRTTGTKPRRLDGPRKVPNLVERAT